MIYVLVERESRRPDWMTRQSSFMTKIGYTAAEDCIPRIRTLQTGNPRELVVINTFEGTLADEASLHHWARDYKQIGEWFLLSAAVVHHARRVQSSAQMAGVALAKFPGLRPRRPEQRLAAAESDELKQLLDAEFGRGWAAATEAAGVALKDALMPGIEDPEGSRAAINGTRNGTRSSFDADFDSHNDHREAA